MVIDDREAHIALDSAANHGPANKQSDAESNDVINNDHKAHNHGW